MVLLVHDFEQIEDVSDFNAICKLFKSIRIAKLRILFVCIYRLYIVYYCFLLQPWKEKGPDYYYVKDMYKENIYEMCRKLPFSYTSIFIL